MNQMEIDLRLHSEIRRIVGKLRVAQDIIRQRADLTLDDLTQDVFIQLFRNPKLEATLRKILDDHSPNEATHILRVVTVYVKNCLRNLRRKSNRNREYAHAIVPDKVRQPFTKTEQLKFYIRFLPTKLRRCVLLRTEGYTIAEIANEIGICEKTASKRVQSGISLLRIDFQRN